MSTPIEVPTHTELLEIAKTTGLLNSTELVEASFGPGFLPNILAGMSAAVAEEVLHRALQLHRQTFISTAAGAALDSLADDHFGLARQSGVKAIGTIRFSRPTTAGGNVSIAVAVAVTTADGTRFLTTASGLMTGITLDLAIEADVAGQDGIVGAATITVLDTALLDSTITVSNVEATAGGIDAETDSDFRSRIRGFLATVRRGTKAALEFGSLSVAGVATASVDEATEPITVYIADVTGGSNSALRAAVATELDNWRAAGIQVNVLGATVVNQTVDLTLTFQAGFDTTALRDEVIAAVLAYINSLSIGETLLRAQLITAVGQIEGVLNVTISDPAGDVVPAANQLLRTSATLVTLT